MDKQGITITIKDVANLILSFETAFYCAKDSEDNKSFCIMDYYISGGRYVIGGKFRMTISKDKVSIFYFPTLNISIPIANETEFQELVSLYIDFKNKVHDYLIGAVKGMITVKSNHRNPFDAYEAFLNQVREDRVRNDAQRRRNAGRPWVAFRDMDGNLRAEPREEFIHVDNEAAGIDAIQDIEDVDDLPLPE